jgi:hypothetical protein
MRAEKSSKLAEAIIEALALPIDDLHSRLRKVEGLENIVELTAVDFQTGEFKNGSVGVWKNGIWKYSTDTRKWRCITRGLWDARLNEVDGKLSLEIELSDGMIIRSRPAKAVPSKPTKPVSIAKRSKPVALHG